jgi:hypothetical protein
LSDSTLLVTPPLDLTEDDLGIISSAYGPEEAGDLRDVVDRPPLDLGASTAESD